MPLGTETRTVLVVDDDPAIRDILETALEDEGYTVECAANGQEALDKADQCQPHAVVLDVMMPVLDGWEFLAHWSRRPVEQQAPVLVVSAVGGLRAAVQLGARDFLAKPFDVDVLLRRLCALLP